MHTEKVDDPCPTAGLHSSSSTSILCGSNAWAGYIIYSELFGHTVVGASTWPSIDKLSVSVAQEVTQRGWGGGGMVLFSSSSNKKHKMRNRTASQLTEQSQLYPPCTVLHACKFPAVIFKHRQEELIK